ncbi:hypothetical protein MMC26_006192 [Xylographa opegraphella]|nr:hypothetical protein [Xylographa opegraphella]
MPAKVLRHHSIASGNNSGNSLTAEMHKPQSRVSEATVQDQSSFGEGRGRKRLQKSPSLKSLSSRRPDEAPSNNNPDSRSNVASRRRQSLRDTKVPLGTKQLQRSPSKQNPINITAIPYRSTSSSVRQVVHSRQASINNTLTSDTDIKGPGQKKEHDAGSEGYPFLPAVNFDDFHSSITSGVANVGAGPRKRGGYGAIPGEKLNDVDRDHNAQDNGISRPASTVNPEGRLGRSGSLMQRQNSFLRPRIQPSFSTSKLEVMAPPETLVATKSRRQSHFPTSTTNLNISRPPRKSIGPGVIPSSSSDYAFLKEASLLKAEQIYSIKGHSAPSIDSRVPVSTETTFLAAEEHYSNLAAGDLKAKSLHASATFAQGYPLISSNTPDNSGGSLSTRRSPNRAHDHGTTTPSSVKRLSIVPGHATGLGARTISPTDVRRLKRLSMMPNPPPLPQSPLISLPDLSSSAVNLAADSSSLIPRKSITPSSNRTTPDHNRKSYCSVVSNSSNTSYNSIKPPANLSRLQPTSSSSRLPTLKSRNETATNGNEEEVPPVPAIPKAYESPKNELDIPFFASRKSSLTFDTSSQNSSSTDQNAYAPPPAKEILFLSSNNYEGRGQTVVKEIRNEDQPSRGAHSSIRNLQPLRLPPLNLLPLSTPTADKIAALHDRTVEYQASGITPPPKRSQMKTPSTPMTASKASFFSRHQYKMETIPLPPQNRSSSSHYATRSDSPSFRAASSSSSSAQESLDNWTRVNAVSPFISSSLPKSSGEFKSLLPKASSERVFSDSGTETKSSRLTGPREQIPSKHTKTIAQSQPSSPMEVESHSFGRTIRRKLSLTRKRSISKAEKFAIRDSEYRPQPPKHDAMMPPGLPASTAWNGPWLSNPSPIQKQIYSSQRKASNAEAISKVDTAQTIYLDGTLDTSLLRSIEPKSGKAPLRSVALATLPNIKSAIANGTSPVSQVRGIDGKLDRDDLGAEDEMKRLAVKRKDTESAAKELDELRRRAVPKERVSAAQALRTAKLNIFERGEIIDYNEVYFCGTQTAMKFTGNLESEAANFGYDDERGDYNIVNGDHLSYRYEIIDVLGKGSFGQVVRCIDHKTGGLVAIKIIRNKKRFHQQALVEVNILQKLREWDPQSKFSMVSFTQSFYFRGHLCISTELLGMNLYEFIKIHDFKGFSVKLIRRFTKQLLNSLVLLKSHKVIHCDLKPENILLAHPIHSEIKVIDFGSSCLENEKVYTYIQSRFYRSPEVILGMTYGMPIDMWSLGCILAELLTGYPIFPGENEQEQLACIMEVFGPPDKHLIEKSTRKKLFFDSLGKPRLTVSSKGKRRRPSSKTLQQALKCDDDTFLDFIARCLRWDPERRMKPEEAISHEFITGIKPPSTRNLRSLPSSAVNVNSSPMKRFNSVHTPASAIRPLPELPTTSLKNGTHVRNMERQTSGSPSKRIAPKRHSTMTGFQPIATADNNPRRIANGAASISMSSSALPRLGGPRVASGKPDLAAVAAAVATSTSTKLR